MIKNNNQIPHEDSQEQIRIRKIQYRDHMKMEAIKVIEGRSQLKEALKFARNTNQVEEADFLAIQNNGGIVVWDESINRANLAKYGDYIVKRTDPATGRVSMFTMPKDDYKAMFNEIE